MRGCSVAILVLNVLDDSVCQLKDKEGRSLDYSVTSGTVPLSLSLSPPILFLLSPALPYIHTLTIFLALFSISSLHAQILFSAEGRIPAQSFTGIGRHLQAQRGTLQLMLKRLCPI